MRIFQMRKLREIHVTKEDGTVECLSQGFKQELYLNPVRLFTLWRLESHYSGMVEQPERG